MLVVNLVCWAGPDFCCVPGELIDLPEATAKDRVAAGLCRLPDAPAKPTKPEKAKADPKEI